VARPHATKPGALLREHRVRARNLFRDAANRILRPSIAAPPASYIPASFSARPNRALSENFTLGPWIHVSSDVAHLDLARAGERLETRGRVARLYERNGRGWVDIELLIVADDARPIAAIYHTAIYRMPGVTRRDPVDRPAAEERDRCR
jgi:hypothetical protein